MFPSSELSCPTPPQKKKIFSKSNGSSHNNENQIQYQKSDLGMRVAENGGATLLRNAGKYFPVRKASVPRRLESLLLVCFIDSCDSKKSSTS